MNKRRHRFISKKELIAISPFAAAIFIRLFGVFLLIPVIAPFVLSMPNGNYQLAGLAVGIYGLTQAIMLVPLAYISDLVGRKPVLIFCLVIFILGGLIAGSVEHPAVVIIGRGIQGFGASSAVVFAGIGDFTKEETRAQAYALIGMIIGIAFGISIILAVPLANLIGVANIFILTSLIALVILLFVISAKLPKPRKDVEVNYLIDVKIFPYCLAIFAVHFSLSALFLQLPILLANNGNSIATWVIYLSSFLISIVLVLPFIIQNKTNIRIVIAACLMVAIGLLLSIFLPGSMLTIIALVIFFTGFNYLEAILPVKTSKLAFGGNRGITMGLYSISHALGIFFGAFVVGNLIEFNEYLGIVLSAVLVLLWIPTLKLFHK